MFDSIFVLTPGDECPLAEFLHRRCDLNSHGHPLEGAIPRGYRNCYGLDVKDEYQYMLAMLTSPSGEDLEAVFVTAAYDGPRSTSACLCLCLCLFTQLHASCSPRDH